MYVRAQKESNTVTFPAPPSFFLLFFSACTFTFLHYAFTNDWSPPSFGITESPLGQNKEPGKTHTHTHTHTHKRKLQEERKNLSEEQCGRVKKWRKQARKWKSSQDSVREPDRGKVLRTGQHVSIRSEVSAVHLRGFVLLTFAGYL